MEITGKHVVGFLLICLMALCMLAAMSSNGPKKMMCAYRGCELEGNVMMRSPMGTVAAFCDTHSAEMYNEGWRVYP